MHKPIFLLLLLTFTCIFLSVAIADPPLNDDCDNADDAGTLVADSAVTLSGSVNESTRDCPMSMGGEVWVTFTLTDCMDVTIDYCDYEINIYSASQVLYDGCPCSGGYYANSQAFCENYNPKYQWYGLAAGTYYYPLEQNYFYSGSYTINITGTGCQPPPENDDCANATTIGEVTDLAFNTRLATNDGEGNCLEGGNNIWYVYTPSFTGYAYINVTGYTYTAQFAVYDGASCSPLPAELACVMNQGVNVPVVASQQYLIEIGGAWGGSGEGALSISVGSPPPANDDCTNATVVGDGILDLDETMTFTGDIAAATNDCENVYNPEVWIKFTTQQTMNVIIDLCDDEIGAHDSWYQLYEECPCGEPFNYDDWGYCENDNSSLTWNSLPAGTYYYPIINQGNDEPYTVNVTGEACPLAPANDSCVNASDGGTLQAGVPMLFEGTNIGATNDCEYVSYPEVWIKFTLPMDMHITIDYCGTDPSFESSFYGLFDSCPCSEPIESDNSRECEDYNPLKKWYALSAGTYWYPIIKNSGASGDYTVHVTGEEVLPPPTPIEITAPITVSGNTSGAFNNCYLVSGEDITYAVTIPEGGTWLFSLCNSAELWDSYLNLGTSLCGQDLGFDIDRCDGQYHAKLQANGLAAGVYYLTVDSYTGQSGSYSLEISRMPSPCEGSHYSNGDYNLENGIIDYRLPGDFESFAADDFILTESVTINSIIFTCASMYHFNFARLGDYQILDGTGGTPGEVLFEGTGVACNRTATGEFYQGGDEVYVYQFDSLDISLEPGTYFLACRPVANYAFMPSYWLTTGNQTGSMAYYKDAGNPEWSLAEVNSDLSFCLFTVNEGYQYLPGDANMSSGAWPPSTIGGDVTYLVNYFRGITTPCMLDGFYASADANGSCSVTGADVTKLVSYFRGMDDLNYCPDYPTIWPPLPENAPDGWPNCASPVLSK